MTAPRSCLRCRRPSEEPECPYCARIPSDLRDFIDAGRTIGRCRVVFYPPSAVPDDDGAHLRAYMQRPQTLPALIADGFQPDPPTLAALKQIDAQAHDVVVKKVRAQDRAEAARGTDGASRRRNPLTDPLRNEIIRLHDGREMTRNGIAKKLKIRPARVSGVLRAEGRLPTPGPSARRKKVRRPI